MISSVVVAHCPSIRSQDPLSNVRSFRFGAGMVLGGATTGLGSGVGVGTVVTGVSTTGFGSDGFGDESFALFEIISAPAPMSATTIGTITSLYLFSRVISCQGREARLTNI